MNDKERNGPGRYNLFGQPLEGDVELAKMTLVCSQSIIVRICCTIRHSHFVILNFRQIGLLKTTHTNGLDSFHFFARSSMMTKRENKLVTYVVFAVAAARV